ncbi:MAG TPA: 6-bladed beta-propeller [Longimicrobiales bacterium]
MLSRITSCLLVGVLPAIAHAQSDVRIAPEPLCKRCSVDLELVATLGSVDGPGALSGPIASIAVDSKGRFYVADYLQSYQILVYEPNGDFLGTIGRRGDGPGEYRHVVSVHIGDGDTLHIFDRMAHRYTVLGPDWNVVRTRLFPGAVMEATSTSKGEIVVSAQIRTPDRIGLPLHRFAGAGDSLISFGSENPVVRPDMRYLETRRIAPSRDGGVWSAHEAQYHIERWGLDGKKKAGLYREVDWFPPYPKRLPLSPDNEPYPMLSDIHEDRAGRLWVAVWVPDTNWKAGLGEKVNGPEGPYYRIVDHSRLLDTMFEVIDPRTGRLVMSQRLPQMVIAFLNDETIAGYRTDDDGIPFIDIWRVRIK